ncbi:MAG: 30S ribosomal protein S1 [Nitrospiraceae bacterium]|nr:MAG: 30S ribosomal protein S1 [Nitrospiraceae bacterium]
MELEHNEMARLYAETFHNIEEGLILTGTVIAVKENAVLVDIGYKSEGFIPLGEFRENELAALQPGQEIEVFLVHINDSEGVVRLSKERAGKIKIWEILVKAASDGTCVEGRITEKIKGGLNVDVCGIKAFLPGSQIDTKSIKDLDGLIGREMSFKVLKINNKRSNVIVSRRAVIEEERMKQKSRTIENIREGALMEGTVKNITDYGVFVDLGGIDGLLHISDISWGRINHPSEFFVLGDAIEVMVLKFDRENERVTLGYKQKHPDPWENVYDKYPAGMKVKSKVVGITDYGVFIKLEEGLEGLVHISELDWLPKLKHPSKYLTIGETIEAVVLKVDKEERKLSLSIRQTKPSPWELVSERYHVGQKISGKVKSLTDFGAFIGLPEGIDGLIHISDMAWTKHVKHPSEMLRRGQKIEAVILALDADHEKMSLGLKQLEEDPWLEKIPSRFRLGDEVKGTVLNVADFGIFLELDEGVEGLIYSSEIVNTHKDGTDSEPSPIEEGEEIWARIIKIDINDRKIGLSMKNLHQVKE